MQAFRYPETWAASVAGDGFTDIIAADEQQGGIPEIRQSLGDPAENEDEWRQQNPIDELERLDSGACCPLFLWHTQTPDSSEQLREAILERGLIDGEDFRFVEFSNQGHVPKSTEERTERWDSIAAFLDDYLRQGESSSDI